MKVAGIIAEYNPFHNGHKYHLEMTREIADAVVAVMSGDFVQRAEPAVISKFSRARTAVDCGVDLVIELPVFWSMAGAQRFAFGGVSLLQSLGCIDYLCFGSECADINRILLVSKALESVEVSDYIKNHLSASKTFASIREEAIKSFLGEDLSELLKTPNDILGIEYCSALLKLGSDIEPIPIKREKVSHDSENVNGAFASASYIRELIRTKKDFFPFVPHESFNLICDEINNLKSPADIRNIERAVLMKLRNMKASDFDGIPDISEGIENRIISGARKCSTLDELYDDVKTKRYTHSRIRRIVLSAFLDLNEMPQSVPYIRVLAFNDKGAQLLKRIKTLSDLPIIVNKSDYQRCEEDVKRVFEKSVQVSEIFSLMTPRVLPFSTEFTTKIYKKHG